MQLVPDKTFKKKLMVNQDAGREDGALLYVANIGYMEIGVFPSAVVLYRARVPGFHSENEVTLSFCENISTMIKSPSLMQAGWLTFVTPSFGVNHADLGTPVSRGEMDVARFVAEDVERRS